MSFSIPPQINDHIADPDLNTYFNSKTAFSCNVTPKSAGNLPITNTAGQFTASNSAVIGVYYDFPTAIDATTDNKLFVWHTQFNAPNRINTLTVANAGMIMRFGSGTGTPSTDYKDYYVGGMDTPFGHCIKGQVPFVIDMSDTSQDTDTGTFTSSNITQYAWLVNWGIIVGNNSEWSYNTGLYLFDTIKDSSDTPTFVGTDAVPQDAVDLIQGNDYTDKYGNWVRQIGSVVFIDVGFRIGDNASATEFDDEGNTIISPVSNDSDDPRNRLTTNACRVYLNLRDTDADTADFSGSWFWGTRAKFDFSQDNGAVVNLNSPTFSGMGEFEIGGSVSGTGTWDDVGLVKIDSDVDIDNSIFKNPANGHLLEIT